VPITFNLATLFRTKPRRVRLGRGLGKPRDEPATLIEVTVGQRHLPGPDGQALAVASYAGVPPRHLLLVADGARGPLPSRQAAQQAIYAVTSRLRGTPAGSPEEALASALWEAHAAVARGVAGSYAEGRSGAGLCAVWLGSDGLAAARIGGGQAYVLHGDRLLALFPEESDGFLGDGESRPLLQSRPKLPAGARVLLLTEAAARAVGNDLEAVAGSAPAQLAAIRVSDQARRRGATGALAVLVAEAELEIVPKGAGASLGRLGETTKTNRGRLVSAAVSASRSWWGLAVLALLAGALLAALELRFWRRVGEPLPPADAASLGRGAPSLMRPADLEAGEARAVPDLPSPPVAALEPAELGARLIEPDPPPPPLEASIAAVFAEPDPDRAALELRRQLRLRYREEGQAIYDAIASWLRQNPSRHGFEVLAHLATLKTSKRTREWARVLLIELYAEGESNR
jgi:hypothetical protein